MIFKDFLALQTVFLLAFGNGKAEKTRKCYVCVPKFGPSVTEVTQMFPEGPAIPSCDGFDEGKAYERECPSSAEYGCMTQTEGARMTKTCSDIDIEDCKTANKIKYCYCKGDLCNRERETSEDAGDDEDFESDKFSAEDQGSGFSASNPLDDAFASKEFSTTTKSNLSSSTTTEANVLSTTTYSSIEESKTNSSSRSETFFFLPFLFFVALFRLI